jgi:hypothetical protein
MQAPALRVHAARDTLDYAPTVFSRSTGDEGTTAFGAIGKLKLELVRPEHKELRPTIVRTRADSPRLRKPVRQTLYSLPLTHQVHPLADTIVTISGENRHRDLAVFVPTTEV